MKKLILSALLLMLIAVPAFAKAEGEEYLNEKYDISKVKTALVMPLAYDVPAPASEAFFNEKVSQKWNDIQGKIKDRFAFLLKTPQEIVERDNYIKGAAQTEMLSPQAALEKAISLSGEYVDAVMTPRVTMCGNSVIHHPEEVRWETRYRDEEYYEDGKRHTRSVAYRYKNVTPARDERVSNGAVKIEIRDSKTNDLIYGVSVTATTGEGFFSNAPSLTTHICNVLQNAADRMIKRLAK